tara:strand:+ start:1977 stop:2741 length:765 start_codon:yes stop_codon:yes gene_type:complete
MKQYLSPHKFPPGIREFAVSIWTEGECKPGSITPDLLAPCGAPELIFVQQGTYKKRRLAFGYASFKFDCSFIAGIQDQVIMSQKQNGVQSIGVRFDPMAFYLLFGKTGVAMANNHLSLTDFNNKDLLQLDHTIKDANTTAGFIQALEDYFSNAVPAKYPSKNWKTTANCLSQLQASNGSLDLDDLARAHHLEIETLEKYFQKYLGLSTKTMATILKTASAYLENQDDSSHNKSIPTLNLGDLYGNIQMNHLNKK